MAVKTWTKWGWVVAVTAVVVAALAVWTALSRGQRIEPGKTPPVATRRPVGEVILLKETETPIVYKAVGAVRSRDEVELSSRIVARITEVKVRSGDKARKGAVLIRLDDSDLKAAAAQVGERVRGARAGIIAAEERAREAKAALDLADAELRRSRALFASKDVSKSELDKAEALRRRALAVWNQTAQGRRAAEADLAAAEQGLKQAEATLAYATIRSPIDGVVGRRTVDPGDLASPGRILMRLFDPSRLMLEAPVRESLVKAVKVGSKASFDAPALGATFEGEVREIVPEVDPGSRTFLVKVCIGRAPDLVPGMFGVLKLDLGKEKALLIPEKAVVRTGQIEQVRVVADGKTRRVLVRTVPAARGMRRVVSGLRPGMRIVAANE